MKIVTGIILTSVAAFSGAAYAADAGPTTGSAEAMSEHAHTVMENGSPVLQRDVAGKCRSRNISACSPVRIK